DPVLNSRQEPHLAVSLARPHAEQPSETPSATLSHHLFEVCARLLWHQVGILALLLSASRVALRARSTVSTITAGEQALVTEVGPGAWRFTLAPRHRLLQRHAAARRRFFMRASAVLSSRRYASASRRGCHISTSIDRASPTATPRGAHPTLRAAPGAFSATAPRRLPRNAPPTPARKSRCNAETPPDPSHRKHAPLALGPHGR